MSADQCAPEFHLTSSSPSTQSWFAVRVKSNCEKIVVEAATQKGYESFLPLYRCRRRGYDRFRDLDLPLFPGYVFCRFDVRHRLPLITMPSVVHIVGFGKVPVAVDDAEIDSLRVMVHSGLALLPWPFLETGQRVSIEEGPLRGIEGVIKEIKGSDHLIISITLLQRAVAVEIDRRWVRPFAPQRALHSMDASKLAITG
jgi:transcription antitermination factor NusG